MLDVSHVNAPINIVVNSFASVAQSADWLYYFLLWCGFKIGILSMTYRLWRIRGFVSLKPSQILYLNPPSTSRSPGAADCASGYFKRVIWRLWKKQMYSNGVCWVTWPHNDNWKLLFWSKSQACEWCCTYPAAACYVIVPVCLRPLE